MRGICFVADKDQIIKAEQTEYTFEARRCALKMYLVICDLFDDGAKVLGY